MSQTLALFLDAYRDLNSRKMFWIVLILSALVAASFAAIGLTPTGFEIFWWKIPSPFFNSIDVDPTDFYNTIFLNYGIEFWLSWLATILALISTASIFPDFIATGAVDLYLSKPIGRLRLFITKYLCGLLFVALQIACFCTASFLVIGLRGGAWEPGIFLAIPIVVVFFSYLFCFCVFVGVWTRSTVAAVLLTLLFWVFIFGVHATETTLLTFKITDQIAAVDLDKSIHDTQESLEAAKKEAATRPTTRSSEYLTMLQDRLRSQQNQRDDIHNSFDRPHELFYAVKTVLPKTSETITLLERKLIVVARLSRVSRRRRNDSDEPPIDNRELAKEVHAEMLSRTVSWIVGTSVGFEVVVLSLSAWIFCRRDY